MDKKELGAEIKKQRLKAGLTQAQLAEKIGYSSKQAVNNIESGREGVSLEALGKICEALNLDYQITFKSKK